MTLDQLRVGTRLSLSFGGVLLCMVVLLGVAVSQLGRIDTVTHQILEVDWAGADALDQLHTAAQSSERQALQAFAGADLALGNADAARAKDFKATSATAIDALERLAATEADVVLVKRLRVSAAASTTALDKVWDGIAQSKRADAAKALHAEALPALTELRQQAAAVAQSQKAQVARRVAEADRITSSSRTEMLALGAFALLIGIVATFRLVRSIVAPLDEAIHIAETVASGDLSHDFESNRGGEFGRLLTAMGTMEDTLTDLVTQIKDTTAPLTDATRDIASANSDLLERTQVQADSLKNTASSMEQLTDTVKLNAQRAEAASELAVSASGIAERGGSVVGDVVVTMNAISGSSRKVVDIIAVIEGIAFQTNILALNAAVEAARAGEQGRGFAVVASEVRVLAQRSASAAKEIRDLISDSAQQVDNGSRLVGQAGQTMHEIVDAVKRVTSLLEEISVASREQSQGAEQVSQAVMQMDSLTQQNASLVIQAAGASSALAQQAHHLQEAVDRFKV